MINANHRRTLSLMADETTGRLNEYEKESVQKIIEENIKLKVQRGKLVYALKDMGLALNMIEQETA